MPKFQGVIVDQAGAYYYGEPFETSEEEITDFLADMLERTLPFNLSGKNDRGQLYIVWNPASLFYERLDDE